MWIQLQYYFYLMKKQKRTPLFFKIEMIESIKNSISYESHPRTRCYES